MRKWWSGVGGKEGGVREMMDLSRRKGRGCEGNGGVGLEERKGCEGNGGVG